MNSKIRFIHITVATAILANVTAIAQKSESVVVGKFIDRPHAIMVLNPANANQGVLVPQLTTSQRLAMSPSSPEEDGLLLFDTSDKSFYFWKNNAWVKGLGPDATHLTGTNIVDGSISGVDIANASLSASKIAGGANNTILTTDNNGVVKWSNTNISGIAASGDLGGTYPAPVVMKLRGNDVAPTTLAATDAGKVLTWNGTQWTPQMMTGTSADRYVMVDPSEFTNLRRGDKKDKDNIIMFDDNSTFVTTIKKSEGSDLIAPLQLPDGAFIIEVTLYYMDRDPSDIVFTLYRKTPLGGNEKVIGSWSSTGNSGTIRSSVLSPVAGTEAVDNNNYSYRIVVSLDQSVDVIDANSANLRVYAVKVKYRQQL